MQQGELRDHELIPSSVWGTTKIVLYEGVEIEPSFWRPRRKYPRRYQSKKDLAPTRVSFAKNGIRKLEGKHMEITLGRILFNLHVFSERSKERAIVSLVEVRYRNMCQHDLISPSVIMTDSHRLPTYGKSYNEISDIIWSNELTPVWFLPPEKRLGVGVESTGWIVFDRLARDGFDRVNDNGEIVVPRHLRLTLSLFEDPDEIPGRIEGEEIFEFTFV